ncbi:MAG: DNA replication/repair protein RecF [Clostridia bacterium]|nr:DNA replication/repair protein RecF [Clostridia bacterium]
MKINSLKLNNFRNAADSEIVFSPGVNLLYGLNAQGKTNAIEAIYYLAGLKSFRCPKYREMIAHDSVAAKIEAQIEYESRLVTLSAELPKIGRRTLKKNSVKPEKLSEFLGVFRAVLFCPEHLRLVKDGPGERRAFADAAVCQLKSHFVSVYNEFNRVFAQRSALFRRFGKNADPEQLKIWDGAYAVLSVRISRMRKEYLQLLSKRAAQYYELISSGGEKLDFEFISDVDPTGENASEELKKLLEEHRETEIKNLSPPRGAHRDDIKITLDRKSARFYASQGQQRSIVLAMKLAEGDISRELTGETPVFLLDDVLSELDENRRGFILSNVGSGQVIITSCDTSLFDGTDGVKKIRVSGGVYTAEE